MNIVGKIIFISNRNVLPENDGPDLFGEDLNEMGAEELNLATAEFLEAEERWKFELLTDSESAVDAGDSIIRQVFQAIMDLSAQEQDLRPWVLLVHGFNQSIEDNLSGLIVRRTIPIGSLIAETRRVSIAQLPYYFNQLTGHSCDTFNQ